MLVLSCHLQIWRLIETIDLQVVSWNEQQFNAAGGQLILKRLNNLIHSIISNKHTGSFFLYICTSLLTLPPSGQSGTEQNFSICKSGYYHYVKSWDIKFI